jgi:hypothetical protein
MAWTGARWRDLPAPAAGWRARGQEEGQEDKASCAVCRWSAKPGRLIACTRAGQGAYDTAVT